MVAPLVAALCLIASPADAAEIRHCFATKDLEVFDGEKLILAARRSTASGDTLQMIIDTYKAKKCEVLAGQYVTIGVIGEVLVVITSKSCTGAAVATVAFASTDCR